jgi:hypothetical protein
MSVARLFAIGTNEIRRDASSLRYSASSPRDSKHPNLVDAKTLLDTLA